MTVILICIFTFCFAYVLTPPVIGLSWKIGAVDIPCDWRRMHHVSVPRAGGLSIFAAFFVGALLAYNHGRELFGLLGGGCLMLFLGLADDLVCLGAGSKLLFQTAIVVATVYGSGYTEGAWTFLAILWVLILVNAHNFIDGLDGLLAGTTAIEGGMLAFAFLLLGVPHLAVLPLLLAISCLAFRFFNRFPAQIFAGDCGSETVGYLLGMISLPLFRYTNASNALLSVLFIFAYPLTDLFTAVLRRVLRLKSPFAADRGHLHHRICAAGSPQVQCVRLLHLLTLALGSIGSFCTADGWQAVASGICVFTVFLMIKIRRFVVNFA